MAEVSITIQRKKVYAVAEGISATIATHNGGTPAFEQLWASESEAPKLDIYYREAVGDLERRVMDWASATSAKFDLEADGTDYTLHLGMSRFWPSRLEGLLANKVQDYLVHAVTAGWLNDFDGLNVKQDYKAMSASDLLDIVTILYQRSFDFQDSSRAADGTAKDDPETISSESRTADGTSKDDPESISAQSRTADGDTKDDPESVSAGSRSADGTTKDDPESISAQSRTSDGDTKDDPESISAGSRAEDAETKGRSAFPEHAFSRRKDDVVKRDQDSRPRLCIPQNQRHRDNAVVDTRADFTDWSGTGMAFADRMPPSPHPHRLTRPQMGMGFTPSPVPPPQMPPQNPCAGMSYGSGRPRDPRIPDNPTHPNYPDFFPNGKDWSDKPLYDAEGSEHDMQRHDCGRHACGMGDIEPLDWDVID